MLLVHEGKDRAAIWEVESDIVLPRPALVAMARANPHTLPDLRAVGVLGSVRLRMYGEAIREVLGRVE